MLPLLLLSRLLVSATFLLAGLSKLRDRPGSRQSLLDFGLPNLLATPGAILLPISEIAIALGLLLASFAWISAIAATALLLVFILAIAITLARGRKPDCHCFGQLHSKPIGWGLAARDAALAAIAALVISQGPRQPSFFTTYTTNPGGPVFLAIGVAVLALLILQSFLIYQLIQQGGRVLLRLDALEKGKAPEEPAPPPGLPLGDPAPEFELPDLDSVPTSLQQLRSGGKPVILLFIHPGCGPCTALLPEAAAWQHDSAAHFNLVPISQGSPAENRANTNHLSLRNLLLQREHEISDLYDAAATPTAVLVRPDGTIGSPTAAGAEAIRSLVSTVINESVAGLVAIQLQEGSFAPPLVFPDLEGRMFNLAQLRGKPAILLFWNPGCGFCQQMSDDLKAWEKKAAKAGTQVVLISTGAVEANRKQNFRSPILLDANFSAGKAFGATGTPSALLLDHQSRIASKVAVGKQDIQDTVFNVSARIAPVG